MQALLHTLMTVVFILGTAPSLVYLGLSCVGRRSSALSKKLFTVSLVALGAAIVLAALDSLVSR